MHLVKGHHCWLNFLAQPIRREDKFDPTSKLAIYEQKCKLSKRTNRQISLALLERDVDRQRNWMGAVKLGGIVYTCDFAYESVYDSTYGLLPIESRKKNVSPPLNSDLLQTMIRTRV
jgi:hypothetical protein